MDELDILALSNLSLPQADRAGELNALARKEKLAREMTHHPYQNPYGGLAENLAVGVYESPGNTAALLDFLASQSLPGRVTQLLSPTNTTLKGLTDQSAGLEGVMAGYHPESYTASPALQGLARLTGNIAGDPLEALPLGWVAGRGAKGLANAALSPKSPIHEQLGAIVFHGSPHKFDRFSHKFMGTGEGAQAYGWGTYLAENPGVARSYAATTTGGKTTPRAWTGLGDVQKKYALGADKMQMLGDMAQAHIDDGVDTVKGTPIDEAVRAIKSGKAKLADQQFYEVDLPDEHIEKMLDWDAPLSEQPEAVRKLFNQYADDIPELGKRNPKGDFVKTELIEEDLILTAENDSRLYNKPEVFRAIEKYKQNPADITTRNRLLRYFNDYPYDPDTYPNFLSEREAEYAGSKTGELYKRIAAKIGKHDPNAVLQTDELSEGQRILSEALNAEGIPGIKYWDGGSRAAGDGTRNYVVFDENLMTVLKRNNEPLLPMEEHGN